MAQGPDDGDEEELVDIELEVEPEVDVDPASPPRVPAPPPLRLVETPVPTPIGVPIPVADETTEAMPDLPDITPDFVEVRQPMAEAAAAEAGPDRALYDAEADAATDPNRRAVLLDERARLADTEAEALDVARRAFAASPGLATALWPLRRLLSQAGAWDELADAYAAAAAVAPRSRANLLVEHGRLCEDRLGQDFDAIASYRDALAGQADHPGALLSLLLAGARLGERAVTAAALEGLARRSGDGTRRAALAIAAARVWRAPGGQADGASRALALLDGELAHADAATPVGALLVELDALTNADAPVEVTLRALDELARRAAPVDAGFAVALRREQARLLVRRAGTPEAALAALDEAAALDGGHPLVAAERMELAAGLARYDLVDSIAAVAIVAAASDDEAVDLALLHAELATRAGRGASAATSLEAPRVMALRPARADLRAFALAGATLKRDSAALADGLEAEAALAPTHRRVVADALAASGAIRQWRLDDALGAEACYRAALAAVPGHRPALRALAGLLSGERGAELATLLEEALAAGAGGGDGFASGEDELRSSEPIAGGSEPVRGVRSFEAWLRATLVAIYAHELGDAGRALPHQRRLVALAPASLDARARLHDLELAAGVGDVDNLLAMAAAAGDPAVTIALKVDAGRGLLAAPTADAVARGRTLLFEVVASDPTGLAGAALEQSAETSDARAELVAAELIATTDAGADVVRALRLRLAHHHAASGRYAEAMAALTPLRSLGDPIARAWSYELARRSGEAILEVAVLFDETNATDRVLGDEVDVLLAHGEALARAGDPHGAAVVFRRVLTLSPTGPTAPDAALALFRIAAADSRAPATAVPEALHALALACADDPTVAAAAAREEALQRLAAGGATPDDLPGGEASTDAATSDVESPAADASTIVRHFLAGIRLRDPGAVASALLEIAGAAGPGADVGPLYGRALGRARAGGAATADPIARQIWRRTQSPVLTPSITDIPTPDGGAWPATRPDPRRPRARRIGGALGVALDLEAALDAERRGALATALAIYGGVIATEPDRLEAWTGIRRVARAGGDLAGEARALARLGALVRDLNAAAALLGEAATVFEQAGRIDDAITALAKAVELKPSDAATYGRVHALLRAEIEAPGRAELFDALLSHRLAVVSLGAAPRVALLYERAQHRLQRLGDRPGAFQDFKEILNVLPEHREALYQLARGAFEDDDHAMATPWYERYLAIAGDDARAAEARLELATSYEHLQERVRAIETLRRAAAARPGDPKPLHRMAELHLRHGEWRPAVEALRASEPRIPEASARAALHVRIGATLRDLGRDAAQAAAAFRRATELDPLGEGTRSLVALHEAVGDRAGALETVEREIVEVRRTLAADPLNVPLLNRLREYLALAGSRGSRAPIAASDAAVAGVLRLIQSRPAALESAAAAPVPVRPLVPQGASARAFWTEMAHPATVGFISEILASPGRGGDRALPAAGPGSQGAAGRSGRSAPRLDHDHGDGVGARGAAAPARARARRTARDADRGRRQRGAAAVTGAGEQRRRAVPGRACAGDPGSARDGARAGQRRAAGAAVRVRGGGGGRAAAARAPQADGRDAARGDAIDQPQGQEGAGAAGLAVRVRELRPAGLARGGAADRGSARSDDGGRRGAGGNDAGDGRA